MPVLGSRGAASIRGFGFSGASVPGAPIITGVTRNTNGTVTVSFSAPSSNGGSPITSYTATSTPGNITGSISQAGSGSITISGLTLGTSYTFKVYATNLLGNSPESAASSAVTAATPPGTPTSVSASVASATSATITFSAPSSNGEAITGYTITSNPGSLTRTTTNTTYTFTGLTTGTAYTFTVYATNAVGDGSTSTASNSVTPQVNYSIVRGAASVDEGSTVTFSVTAQYFGSGTLYWSTQTISGTVNSADFTDNLTTGSVTITNDTGTISRTLSDPLTTEGTESFRIQLRTGATTGTIVATSGTVTINDTAVEPTCGPYSDITVTGSTTGGTVWGSNPYTDDSDFARAAVHAGLLSPGQTGTIRKTSAGYRFDFTGSTANGVTTNSYTSGWCGVTITLVSVVTPASVTYNSSALQTNDATSYSFNMSLGTTSSTRRVVVVISGSNSGSNQGFVTSVSIAGVTADIHVNRGQAGTDRPCVAIASAIISNTTSTGIVAVTWDRTRQATAISLYNVQGATTLDSWAWNDGGIDVTQLTAPLGDFISSFPVAVVAGAMIFDGSVGNMAFLQSSGFAGGGGRSYQGFYGTYKTFASRGDMVNSGGQITVDFGVNANRAVIVAVAFR